MSNLADEVAIVFNTKGVPEVIKTFDSVSARMRKFEKDSLKDSTGGASARVRVAKGERSDREREMAALAKTAARWEKEAAKDAERAGKAKAQAEARAAKERGRIVETSAKSAGRIAAQAASLEIREAERAAKAIARIRENSANMAGRLAAKQAREEAAAFARVRSSRGATAGNIGGIIGRSTGRALGGMAAIAGGALALGGGFSIAESLRGEMAAQKAAIGLVNSLPDGSSGGVTSQRVLGRAKAIQAATNISKNEAIEGMHAYIAKTGDGSLLAEGDSTLMDLAKLSKATGTNYADMLGSAGLMKAQNTKLTGPGLVDMMRVAAAQGMTGAVELSDLAKIGGKITASRGAYGADQTSAQRQLLGLAQIAYPTAGSADEAATVVTRFGADALAHTKQLGALGLVDKNGLLANPDQVVSKVLGATGGNLGKIHEQFGFNKESIKLFEQLAPGYREALAANGGDRKKAEAAISKQITDVTGVDLSEKSVNSRFGAAMSADDERLQHAINQLADVIATKGTPYLERFIDKLPELMPKFEAIIDGAARLAAFFVANPFTGIGAVVLANIAKDLAAAGIGAAVKSALVAAASGLPVPGATAGVAGIAKGAGGLSLAAGGGLVAAAAAGALVAAHGIDTDLGSEAHGQALALGAATDLGNVGRQLKAGQISPEQAKARLAQAQEILGKGNVSGGTQALGALGGIAGPLGAVDAIGSALGAGSSVTGASAARTAANEGAGVRAAAPQLTAAISELSKAIERMGTTAGNQPAPSAPRSVPIAGRGVGR